MPWYRVSGTVVGGKYLGVFKADTAEAAQERAIDEKGDVSLCHQCSSECENGEVTEAHAVEITAQEAADEKKGNR